MFRPSALIAAALLFVAVSRAAETLGTVPDSAAALGMVGGRYANPTDLSAIHYTPAQLADQLVPEAQLNYALWYGDVRFIQAGTGEKVRMDDPWKMLGSFYAAYPIKPGKLVFGLGVTTPFGLDSRWPRHGVLKYLIPYEATLLTIDINPVLAFKPVESVSVGVGFDILYSSLDLKQLYPWSQAVPGLRDGTIHFDADGWGVGAFAGLTWKITPRQRLSIIGRLPLEVEYRGRFTATRLPAFAEATGATKHSDFKSDIRFPGSIAAGYGLDVTDRLTVGADLLWAANSSHDDLPLDAGSNQALIGPVNVPLNWEDAFSVGTGVQYQFDSHWAFRGGYLYSEASQRDTNYTPSVPSNERHLFSIGLGYRSLRHSLSLAYSYSLFPDRTVTGNVQPAFNGRYDLGWHVLSTSYSYRF